MCHKKIKRILNLENIRHIQEIITYLINRIEDIVKNDILKYNNQKEVLNIMININYVLIERTHIMIENIEKRREKISRKNHFLLSQKYKESICKRNGLNLFIQNKFNEIYNIKINNYSRVLEIMNEYLDLVNLLKKLNYCYKKYLYLNIDKIYLDQLNKNEKMFEKISQDITSKFIKVSYLLTRISKE